MTHWHAYAWTGPERPADRERVDPANPAPPLEIADWLRKQVGPEATFGDRERAAAWLRAQGEEHRHLSHGAFPLDERMEYVHEALGLGTDVVWGYYSTAKRYVSRSLIACPREHYACPAPPGAG
ncbi:hypothetical protein [Streptomyces sp. NPDC059994]|uniref:hypothetical protein n=1 Tax=Streptomyces sp. NPDC059994 TaxID=3347029 RepID=UPI0036D03372